MAVATPRLSSIFGAELNLRSQMLFLDHVNTEANDLLTATAAWNARYVHESSHWVRFHGSSIGVLLTLLRRTRDSLAAHTLNGLDSRDIASFSRQRFDGNPMFGYSDTAAEARLGRLLSLNRQLWLDLHSTYQILLEPRDLDESALNWLTKETIESGLDSVWSQSKPEEMFARRPPREKGVNILGGISLVAGAEGLISTRLLLECAAVLDEVTQWAGNFNRHADRAVLRMQEKTFRGEYGIPYRFAERTAGCKLEPFAVLAMIDFALNPVVPGLHDGAPEVDWQEIHPPSRFVRAAEAVSDAAPWKFDVWPSREKIVEFHAELEKRTGLRMGAVSPPLSDYSSLRECAASRVHYAQRIPGLTLFYSADLMHERNKNPHLISHFGVNFVGPDACRHVNPELDAWSIFPPLAVAEGRYCWPSEHLTIDDATVLLIGSAVSAAYDDAVHGSGVLSKSHLPAFEFSEREQVSFFNEEARKAIRFPLSWTA
jgi:hypothetical protein